MKFKILLILGIIFLNVKAMENMLVAAKDSPEKIFDELISRKVSNIFIMKNKQAPCFEKVVKGSKVLHIEKKQQKNGTVTFIVERTDGRNEDARLTWKNIKRSYQFQRTLLGIMSDKDF